MDAPVDWSQFAWNLAASTTCHGATTRPATPRRSSCHGTGGCIMHGPRAACGGSCESRVRIVASSSSAGGRISWRMRWRHAPSGPVVLPVGPKVKAWLIIAHVAWWAWPGWAVRPYRPRFAGAAGFWLVLSLPVPAKGSRTRHRFTKRQNRWNFTKRFMWHSRVSVYENRSVLTGFHMVLIKTHRFLPAFGKQVRRDFYFKIEKLNRAQPLCVRVFIMMILLWRFRTFLLWSTCFTDLAAAACTSRWLLHGSKRIISGLPMMSLEELKIMKCS